MVGPAVIRPGDAPLVDWRPGVRTRLHQTGSIEPASFCILEQWCEPGRGAPTHVHDNAEELVLVLEGEAEIWADGPAEVAGAGASVLLPAGSWHGFRNAGEDELHTLAVFGVARPHVRYEDAPEVLLTIGGESPEMHDAHRAVVPETAR
jgi:quercetin dioxygenase-like cupin family protein